jgi:hypothetical protein
MARAHPPRSTAEASFRSPLVVLPLAVRGGSRIEHATLEHSRFIRLDQRRSGEFRTPIAILPLMGGGSGMVWHVKWDPPPIASPSGSCFSSRHLYSTQPHDRAVPNGHFLTLFGFVPIG